MEKRDAVVSDLLAKSLVVGEYACPSPRSNVSRRMSGAFWAAGAVTDSCSKRVSIVIVASRLQNAQKWVVDAEPMALPIVVWEPNVIQEFQVRIGRAVRNSWNQTNASLQDTESSAKIAA